MNELEKTEDALIAAALSIKVIYEMADRADAVSLSGVAACHTMLTSLKKNRKKMETLILNPAREILEKRKNNLQSVDNGV